MSTAQLADPQHPWIGLAPFTESDCEFFAGRGEEIDELLRLVRRDTLTLLYGVSGLGKTSLLQAGLFPALRTEDYLPVPIRLDHVDGAAPLAQQVLSAITKASDAASVEAPAPLPGETLWEYFHRESNHFWSPRNDLVTPFLVFDQFEECFTLGRETAGRERRGAAFITELADLVENRPPAALRADPQRAREFSFKPRPLKVLLAMREDYLAELDRIRSQFRALGQNRLRLLPMGMPQARQVIELGAALIASGVDDRIVRFVAGSAAAADDGEITVAPALLSLVLQQLNERRLEQSADAKITAELLDLQQKKIFEDFYLRTLKPLDPGVRTFIEDRLLTASGFRNSCALDDALSCPGVSQPVLDELVNSRLLAYEDRHRARRVEITHDVLAPVIRASRDSRISREALAKAQRQKAEAQAKERAARRQLRRAQMTAVVAILAVAVAAYGWYLAHEATKRANEMKNELTQRLHVESQTNVDSADGIEAVQGLPFWAKRLLFIEGAARIWPENPNAAGRLWAQLRHGDASRAPLLKWVADIADDTKLAWKPGDGELIANVSPTGPLQLRDAELGQILLRLDAPDLELNDGEISDVRFSSDGNLIILKRSNEVWSIVSREPERLKVIFTSKNAKFLAGEPISPDGRKAIARSNADGSVCIISTLPGPSETIPLVGAPPQGCKVRWSPKGDRIAVSFNPQTTIDIYDASSGLPLREAIEPLKNLEDFSFNGSGEYLLVEMYAPGPTNCYEIWNTDMTEPLPVETKQATFAVWFHENEKKLLWITPTEQATARPARSITAPKYNLVVQNVGANEKDLIELDVHDAAKADISDDNSVSVVLRKEENDEYYQIFNLKSGKANTSLGTLGRGGFTGFLSPNSRSFALAEKKSGENTAQLRWHLSRWDFGSSQQTWHACDAKPPKEVRSHPKWNVRLRGSFVYLETNGIPPRSICSIPLEEPAGDCEWSEDDRKLSVFSRYGGCTDIEWDPPEVVEKPILDLARLVIGKGFDENRQMVSIPDEERVELRKELETAKVKDPRWQKLLKWWNEGRPGD